jgi:hypothetical protein
LPKAEQAISEGKAPLVNRSFVLLYTLILPDVWMFVNVEKAIHQGKSGRNRQDAKSAKKTPSYCVFVWGK